MYLETLSKESLSPLQKRKAAKLLKGQQQKTSDDPEEDKTILSMIEWDERRYIDVARDQLASNYSTISLKNVHIQHVPIKVLSEFIKVKGVNNALTADQQYNKAVATCIAMSDEIIFTGMSDGCIKMFERESEEHYHTFADKSKDFALNPVTAIDVHPTRNEYVVFGYERGQMVLVDITEPNKILKSIKDHHKCPISNIKFCDWQGERAKPND